MGTRALIHVRDDNTTLVSIYRQFDGYPTYLGRVLAEYLANITVGNGIGSDTTNFSNGFGCLAAQLVAQLKNDFEAINSPQAGNIYLYPPDTKAQDCWAEYVYTVYGTEYAPIQLKVESVRGDSNVTIYDGPASEFDPDAAEAAA